MARQLDYSPKADELPMTINVMVDDLRAMNLSEHDSPRVLAAFQRLAMVTNRWPTSAKIKEYLPSPPKTTQIENNSSRPMPKCISDRLIKLGLNRQPGQTARDQAIRCKKWLKQYGGVLPDEVKSNLD